MSGIVCFFVGNGLGFRFAKGASKVSELQRRSFKGVRHFLFLLTLFGLIVYYLEKLVGGERLYFSLELCMNLHTFCRDFLCTVLQR